MILYFEAEFQRDAPEKDVIALNKSGCGLGT